MPNLPKPEPALLKHASTMYEAMLAESETVTLDDGDYTVYGGFLSKTYQAAKISAQYQSQVMQLLETYDCIAVMVKGARGLHSKVALLRHPRDASIPADALKFQRNGRSDLTTARDYARLEQSVKNLSDLLGGVSIGQLVSEIDNKLTSLDNRLTVLEQQLATKT